MEGSEYTLLTVHRHHIAAYYAMGSRWLRALLLLTLISYVLASPGQEQQQVVFQDDARQGIQVSTFDHGGVQCRLRQYHCMLILTDIFVMPS